MHFQSKGYKYGNAFSIDIIKYQVRNLVNQYIYFNIKK